MWRIVGSDGCVSFVVFRLGCGDCVRYLMLWCEMDDGAGGVVGAVRAWQVWRA